MRVTWHPGTATVVFSHWDGVVCTASTPITVGDAAEVAQLVVRALSEVACMSAQKAPPGNDAATALRWSQRWARPKFAAIVELSGKAWRRSQLADWKMNRNSKVS